MGLVAAADMEVGLVAAKTELEVWLVWKEAGKDVGWVSVVLETIIGELKKAFGTGGGSESIVCAFKPLLSGV